MAVEVMEMGAASVIMINRPEALNALNTKTIDELTQAFRAAEGRAGTRAVIFTGAGTKSFVAGGDIAEMKAMTPIDAREYSSRGQALVVAMLSSAKPTIAAINGYALGGGLELALACDIRIASSNAVLGLPETTLATIPGFGGTQRLPRIIGEAKAKELIFTGDRLKATEALGHGLLNAVVEPEELIPSCLRLVEKIAATGPVAVAFAKKAIQTGQSLGLEAGLGVERELFGLTFATDDQKEGMGAFLAKRKPAYRGG
ncbi:MAG: enoyl-CoA hydratase/isomerase family protein [Euryarchaeota archaeon]|nr:enoyl-CoA hydratase/isomerase family protein [Euryarchaeota archaeon]